LDGNTGQNYEDDLQRLQEKRTEWSWVWVWT